MAELKPKYTLDGTVLKNPNDFDHEWYRLTENQRLASGDMTMDSIAVKRKYNLGWTVLSHLELLTIRKVIFGSTKVFYTFSFVDHNETDSLTVYAGALKYKKFRTGSLWYYQDASLSLIEK